MITQSFDIYAVHNDGEYADKITVVRPFARINVLPTPGGGNRFTFFRLNHREQEVGVEIIIRSLEEGFSVAESLARVANMYLIDKEGKTPNNWQYRPFNPVTRKEYWVRRCTCDGDLKNPCHLCRSEDDLQRHILPTE